MKMSATGTFEIASQAWLQQGYAERFKQPLRKLSLWISVSVAVVLAIYCSAAIAQSGAGSIQGTVTDSTGATVSGASVHIVNRATGVASDTKSNGDGFYQVPDLFTGDYDLTVSVPGMKTYKSSLSLLVAQTGVINPVMSAGAVSESVTVSGNAVQLVTTDNGAISSTLENQRINQLPMNSRYLLTLEQGSTPGLENGGENMNGMPPNALDYVVDGTTTTQVLNGSLADGQVQMIDPDSIQEVTLQANGSGAQYATPATGIVTTKSGTNTLHGTAFWTARNNGFGIAKSRQNPSNYSVPEYIRNEFGVSAGGPLTLPYLYDGKDKTFWFVAFERYSLAQKASVNASVPSAQMSQGNFSQLVNPSTGILQQLYDPATTHSAGVGACPTYTTLNGVTTTVPNTVANPYCRSTFGAPGTNQIPLSRISPVAKLYYQLMPQPSAALANVNPVLGNNLTALEPELDVVPQLTARLDHVFNQSNRAYVRYTQALNSTDTTMGLENVSGSYGNVNIPVGAATGYNNYPVKSYLAAIGYTHIFSPSFFAETIVSQQWLLHSYVEGTAYNTNYEAALGLPSNFSRPGFPDIGDGTLIQDLAGSQAPSESDQIFSIVDENLTKTIGKNQMQFGGRFKHLREMDLPELNYDTISMNAQPTGIVNPSTINSGSYTNTSNSGYADASFFLGSASNYTTYLPNPKTHYHTNELDGYFQDNYHLKRNLTVNLGLRYEYHPALWMKYGLANTFDFKNDAMVLAVPPSTLIAEGYTTQSYITNDENIGVKFETPQEAGLPSSIWKGYNLFEPRVGAAYQLFGGRHGMVLRGGFGTYSFYTNYSQDLNQGSKNNPLSGSWSQSYTSAGQAIDGLPNELLRYNDPVQFGVMGVNTSNVINTNSTSSVLPGIALNGLSADAPPPTATEANVTLEKALAGNSALQVSYVFTESNHIDLDNYFNNAPSTYQWEMATGTVPPTGGASVIGTPLQNTYSATATRPYDQTTWGNNNLRVRNGWSNYNSLQVNYQRLFHHGSAYQISYVYAKNLGTSALAPIYPDANYPGVSGTLGTMNIPGSYLGALGNPGAPPPGRPSNLQPWQDWHAMDRYQAYKLLTVTPKMHIKFNGVLDLPFGRNQRFFSNANRFWNELVGGFQIAGAGVVVSQAFQPGSANWGPSNPLVVYKHKKPITDCRTGVCYQGYMWFNGYLAPTVTTGVSGSTCTSNCVSGLPASYMPYQVPIESNPASPYYGSNVVQVTLANGKTVPQVTYDAGPGGASVYSKTFINGPINWHADLSLFKVFPITERVKLRFNLDAFNAFNVQGYNNPNATTGIQDVSPGLGDASSYNTPRQIQLSLRVMF